MVAVLLLIGHSVEVELLLENKDKLVLPDSEYFVETDLEGETVGDSVIYAVRDNRGVPVDVLDITEVGDTVLVFLLVTVLGGERVDDRLIIPVFVTNTDFVPVIDIIEELLLLDVKVPVLEFVLDGVLLGEDVLVLLVGPLLLLVVEAVWDRVIILVCVTIFEPRGDFVLAIVLDNLLDKVPVLLSLTEADIVVDAVVVFDRLAEEVIVVEEVDVFDDLKESVEVRDATTVLVCAAEDVIVLLEVVDAVNRGELVLVFEGCSVFVGLLL